MSCTINLILCLWLWLTVGAGVCVCDLYLSLNVSCESDSNMMFPTHNGGTHTQWATSTWLFGEAIGCSQSFLYPQHRQWACCAIKVWSCEWKNQAAHKEIKEISACNLWKSCCLEATSRLFNSSTGSRANGREQEKSYTHICRKKWTWPLHTFTFTGRFLLSAHLRLLRCWCEQINI